MKISALLLLTLATLTACSTNYGQNDGFVTRLGNDTLAVESFSLDGNQFYADVVVRSPRTILTRYEATLNESGGFDSMEVYRFNPREGFSEQGELYQVIKPAGDSLYVQIHRDGESWSYKVPDVNGLLPFIEYTHWPFELALLQSGTADTTTIPMLVGRRVRDFIVANLGGIDRTIRHPSRGVMDITVNKDGELATLDAAQTTRKLFVERTLDANVETAAAQFAKYEDNGRVFGALSGAIVEEFNVQGVNFRLDYGSPSKRGRELFGGIVPYGERWRTGANRATHIRFDKDISIGGLATPASEYTLFSIPEESGGILMVNTQTGQNGRSYNEELDLGKVELYREVNPELVEEFTITVSETESGGRLNFLWGNTIYFAEIKF